jgi:Cytochrome oxidase complex assembly protein 1
METVMTTPIPAMDQPPPQRSWWSRNWKWVVPVGCLVPLLGCGGLIAVGMVIVFGAIRSSDVYTEAMARAKADKQVQAQLGEPIEAGWMTTGNINLTNDTGTADLTIPLTGPKKSATLHAVATKAAGKWEYTTLDVTPTGSTEHIDLRTPQKH